MVLVLLVPLVGLYTVSDWDAGFRVGAVWPLEAGT